MDRSVVGDGLEGHEVWQHANLCTHGLATTRHSTEASRNNPVIALDHDVHVEINAKQRALDARAMSPVENIQANVEILRTLEAAPPGKIDALKEAAINHAQSLVPRRGKL